MEEETKTAEAFRIWGLRLQEEHRGIEGCGMGSYMGMITGVLGNSQSGHLVYQPYLSSIFFGDIMVPNIE